MNNNNKIKTTISVCIAIISVVVAIFVAGTSAGTESEKKPLSSSPEQVAEKASKGMGTFFDLTEEAQGTIFELYKAYYEIHMPYVLKHNKLYMEDKKMSEEEISAHYKKLHEVHYALYDGVQEVLTPKQFEQWKKKDPLGSAKKHWYLRKRMREQMDPSYSNL